MDARLDGQYVTIGIGDEIFAIAVACVREVLDLCPITRVPNMPDFLRGMIDVRGKAVPVLDMRLKFGLPPAAATAHTRIVVLEVPVAGRSLVMGALADRVYEVIDVADEGVEPPPDIGIGWRSDFLRGIGRRGEAFVLILDLERLFTAEGRALADVAA